MTKLEDMGSVFKSATENMKTYRDACKDFANDLEREFRKYVGAQASEVFLVPIDDTKPWPLDPQMERAVTSSLVMSRVDKSMRVKMSVKFPQGSTMLSIQFKLGQKRVVVAGAGSECAFDTSGTMDGLFDWLIERINEGTKALHGPPEFWDSPA